MKTVSGILACFALGALSASASYTELKSVASTTTGAGDAWINSAYTPKCTDKVEMRCSFGDVTGNKTLFCARSGSTSKTFTLFAIAKALRFDRKGHAGTSWSNILSANTTYTVIYDCAACKGYLRERDDSLSITDTNAKGDFTVDGPFAFFSSHALGAELSDESSSSSFGNTGLMTIFWVKIYDKDGRLMRWYVPARDDSAGETATTRYGLYERVTGDFRANRGNVILGAGAEVAPVAEGGRLVVQNATPSDGGLNPQVGIYVLQDGETRTLTAADEVNETYGLRFRCLGYVVSTYDAATGAWTDGELVASKTCTYTQTGTGCSSVTWKWAHEMRNGSGEWVAYDATDFGAVTLDGGKLELTGEETYNPLRQVTFKATGDPKVATVVDVSGDATLGMVTNFASGGICKTGSGTLTILVPDAETWPRPDDLSWRWSPTADTSRSNPYGTPTEVPSFNADGTLASMGGIYGFNILDGGLRLVGHGTNRVIKMDSYFSNGRGWNSTDRKWSFTLDHVALNSTGAYQNYSVLGLNDANNNLGVYDFAYPTNWTFTMVDSYFETAGFDNAAKSSNSNRSCFQNNRGSRPEASISISLTNSTIRVRRSDGKNVTRIFGSSTPTTMYLTNSVYYGNGICGSGGPSIIFDNSVADLSDTYGSQVEGTPNLYLRNGAQLRCGGIHFHCTWEHARLRCDRGDATVWFQGENGISYGKGTDAGDQKGEINFGTAAGSGDRTVSFGAAEGISHQMGLQVQGQAKVAKIGKGTIYMDQQVLLTTKDACDRRDTGTVSKSKRGIVAGWTGPLTVKEGLLVFSNGTFKASMPMAVEEGATLRIDSAEGAGVQKIGTLGLNGGTLDCSQGAAATFEVPGFTVPADHAATGLTVKNATLTLPVGQDSWTVDFCRDAGTDYKAETINLFVLEDGASLDVTKLVGVNMGYGIRRAKFAVKDGVVTAELARPGMILIVR